MSAPGDRIGVAVSGGAASVALLRARGAGTRGLSGIWPVRQYLVPSTQYPENRKQEAGGRRQENQQSAISSQHSENPEEREGARARATFLIRPMLGVRRKEVEAYLN